MKLTPVQEVIMIELSYCDCYIQIDKNKRGEYSHYLIHHGGRKEKIRSDTSKAIQRYFKSKIKLTKNKLTV